MRKEDLIAFEERIKRLYEEGRIKAPIHLSGGNEEELIQIFQNYHPGDWIFSTWRNHYHWLLSGRDPQKLEDQILAGNSMAVCDDRFFTSAIVGGNAAIALGVALAIALKKKSLSCPKNATREESLLGQPQPSQVWCFMGDMAESSGIAQECLRYAQGYDLPITFIIEDNGLSVTTDTKAVWGIKAKKKCYRYTYQRRYPHAGTGKHVLF